MTTTPPPVPITWRATLSRVVDGDTLRLWLERDVQLDAGHLATVRPVRPGRLADPDDTVPSAVLRDVSVRLVTLDTPERGQPGYREAATDLWDWTSLRDGRLLLADYGSTSLDRLLGDLYVAGDRSDTASAHMLRAGWEPWLPRELRNLPRSPSHLRDLP